MLYPCGSCKKYLKFPRVLAFRINKNLQSIKKECMETKGRTSCTELHLPKYMSFELGFYCSTIFEEEYRLWWVTYSLALIWKRPIRLTFVAGGTIRTTIRGLKEIAWSRNLFARMLFLPYGGFSPMINLSPLGMPAINSWSWCVKAFNTKCPVWQHTVIECCLCDKD